MADAQGGAPQNRIAFSLSGGGFRAMLFAAGCLLGAADTTGRIAVGAINSVSGGSIASAATIGGFKAGTPDDPDPMGRRVAALVRLAQSDSIPTERAIRTARFALASLALPLLFLLIAPIGTEPRDADPGPYKRTHYDIFGYFTNDFPKWVRHSEAMASLADFMAVAPVVLALTIPVVAIVFAVCAIVQSRYAVQSVVECMVNQATGSKPETAVSLAASGSFEPSVHRVYCATDLAAGSHVYLAPGGVITAGRAARNPNVFLADVVAASACFPGFRPLVFRKRELGFGARSDDDSTPRMQHGGGRLAIGTLGACGAIVAVTLVVLRVFGFVELSAVLAAAGAVLVAVGCARLLRAKDQFLLVDGGVYDNLGAAFSLAVEDERYPALSNLAGIDDATLMFVVDASKPFEPNEKGAGGLSELIPTRLRGAQRTMLKLIQNANASGRKTVLLERYRRSTASRKGSVITIGTTTVLEHELDSRFGLDAAAVSADTPTTLARLAPLTTLSLVLHGYRSAQAALDQQGFKAERTRTVEMLVDEVMLGAEVGARTRKFWGAWLQDPSATDAVVPAERPLLGVGPYGRRSRTAGRVARVAQAVAIAIPPIALVITWVIVTTP